MTVTSQAQLQPHASTQVSAPYVVTAADRFRDAVNRAMSQAKDARTSFKLFNVWQEAVMSVLITTDLDRIITQHTEQHSDLHKTYAIRLIKHALDDNIRMQYITESDPHTLWMKLNTSYNRITETTKSAMRVQFQQCQQQDGESAADFLERLKTLRARAQSMGMNIDDSLMTHQIYEGLKSTYATTITIAKQMGQCDINKIIEIILDASAKIEQTQATNVESHLVTNKGFQGRCYNCNTYGHTSRECSRRPREDTNTSTSSSSSSKSQTYRCTWCNMNNHTTEDCGLKKRGVKYVRRNNVNNNNNKQC